MSVQKLIGKAVPYTVGKTKFEPHVVRCHIAILRDSEGEFSAIVLNLPGIGSCGETEEAAVANVREAIVGAVESFSDDGEDIPWVEVYDIPEGAKLKWILVNV